MRWMWLCLGTVGCMQTVHRPVCLDEEIQEIEDDEQTPLGSAAELLSVLTIDGQSEIELADGTLATGSYRAQRGEGPARFVHTETGESVTHQPGFGSMYLMIAVQCMDYLAVPVELELASEDGELLVPALGEATTSEVVGDVAALQLQLPWADAVLPPGEADPGEYENKIVSVETTADSAGVVGSVSWEGTQELEDVTLSESHPVATFTVPR
jgi:hypothetical protein